VRDTLDSWRRSYKTDEATAADVAKQIFLNTKLPEVAEVRRRYYELRGLSVSRWFGAPEGVPFEALTKDAPAP
jgi:hypothetical protein